MASYAEPGVPACQGAGILRLWTSGCTQMPPCSHWVLYISIELSALLLRCGTWATRTGEELADPIGRVASMETTGTCTCATANQ